MSSEELEEIRKLKADLAEVRDGINEIEAYISALHGRDPMEEVRLLFHLRGTGRVTRNAVSVGADHVLDLWLSCMRRIETSWVALQGAPPEETWGLSWGVRLGLHAQEERIHIADCKISRIFLLEHPDDRRRWELVAAAQADIGVRVRWLEKSRLERNHRITERLDRLKTPDVAVADRRWVFLIYVDNNRRTVGAKLSRDQAELEAARFVVEEAYQLGSME